MPRIYRYIKPCSTYQSYAYGALFSPAPLSDFGSPFLDADLALASSLTKKVILPLGLAPKRHEICRENPWVDIVDKPLSTGNEATKTEESRLEYGPSFPLFLAKIYGWHCRIISEKFCDFSELYQFCCSTGVIPAWCVHTLTPRENRERQESGTF